MSVRTVARVSSWLSRLGWLPPGSVAGLAVLYLVFGAVPLVVLADSALSLADGAVRDQVRHRLTTTASASAVVAGQRLSALADLVTAAAGDAELVDGVGHPDRPGGAAWLDGRLRQLLASQPGITEALITDLSGRVVASQPGTEYFTDFSDTDWFAAERSHPGPYVSAAYTPTFPGARRAVAIAAPIRDGAARTVAVLAAAYSLDALQEFAGQIATVQGVELLMTDQTGVVVAQSGADMSLIISLVDDRRIGAALAGQAGYTRVSAPDGWRLSATVPVPGRGWTATATLDERTALAPLRHLRSAVLGTTAVLGGVLLAGLCLQVWLALKRRRAERREQQARDEAVRASERKSLLLATVSHEIRTPMNGIMGMTRLLRETTLDAEQRRYADAVATATQGLLSVVDDLLDLSRIEAGRINPVPAPFDVRRLCAEVIELLAPRALGQGLALHASVDSDVPAALVGDAGRIRQVLVNLVANAVKFTTVGTVSVTVAAEPADPAGTGPAWVTLSVVDTGLGLDAEQQARVFDRYVRLADDRLEGAGLGLTISQELVTLMGGQIGVASEPGSGSRFWFRLPLTVPDPATVSTRAAPVPVGAVEPVPADRGGRVLVADDDEVNRYVAQTILSRAGFDVDVVAGGEQAVAAAQATGYDAVLMDVQMPDLDGVTATRILRAGEPDGRRTTVVAMTASATTSDRERCLAAGMDGFVAKPVDWEHLVAELRLHTWRTDRVDTSPDGDGHGEDGAGEWDDQALRDLRRCGALDEVGAAFAATSAQVWQRLSSAADRHDLATVGALAHRLAGAAATVGAAGLARRCRELQRGADSGEAGVRADLDAVAGHLRQVVATLREMAGAGAQDGAGQRA